MLDLSLIKAITLDLDDTLWPIWPTIERAEQVLADWLGQHAPASAALFADTVGYVGKQPGETAYVEHWNNTLFGHCCVF